jgi:phage-related protein
MAENFGLKIGLEGEKEFKSALAEINNSFKVLGSEMKLVESQFDKNDNSVQALTARNEVLEKSIDAQKSKIETLRNALNNASTSFGETDKRTQAWQIKLNEAEAELNKMERELQNNNKQLDTASGEFKHAEKSADKFGDEVEDAGNQSDDSSKKFQALGGVVKGVAAGMAAAMAAVGATIVAIGNKLIDFTKQGAEYADNVLTQSQVTGIATDKLQEYMYAAELVDVSVDTLTGSMAKQIKSMKSAQGGSKSMVEAYEKLGVEIMNADGTLRDSDEVYWEIIAALGAMENETERDALAMTVLGKSAQELNPLIEAGADKMEELGKQAREAGYVLSDDMLAAYGNLDDQLQLLSNGATALKNALGTVLLPILTELASDGVGLLSEFTNGVKEANGDISKITDVIGEILPKAINVVMKYIPQLLDMIAAAVIGIGDAIVDNLDVLIECANKLIQTFLNAILKALPKLTQGAIQIVTTLVKTILANLPQILQAAIQVIVTLAQGLAKALPQLIPAVVNVVIQLVETLIQNMPLILDAALQIIEGLVQGILEALPILIEALPTIILAIVDFILSAIPQIIEVGIQLLTSLVEALPEIIEAIVAAIPQIIDGIINAVIEALPLIIDAGIKLFVSLIQALPDIIIMIVEAIPQIINGIVEALMNNLDKIIMAGVQVFMALITNLPTIIMELVKAVPQILGAIINAFANGFSQMAEVGKNLVKGLWEGIKSLASWIWDKVSSWASNLWNGIKNFFGIHSPSKKMAFIGDMMMEGLAKGIDETAGEVIGSAEAMTKDLNSVFDGLGQDMSKVPTDFNVTSSVDSLRDTQNAVRGGLSLQLQIANFNNYSAEDINSLTEEIMETADNFIKRKGVVFA